MPVDTRLRNEFERSLSELTGEPVNLNSLNDQAVDVADDLIRTLFKPGRTAQQAFDSLNRVLIFYGVRQISRAFFDRYFANNALRSSSDFAKAVTRYQAESIRLFSTFSEAYQSMNDAEALDAVLAPLEQRPSDPYLLRSEWDVITQIPEERLPDLGYISAARVEKESAERQALASFLRDLAKGIREEGKTATDRYTERKLRAMDSLLRKFGSNIEHGLLSPLFLPDHDAIEREADAVAPKQEGEIARMAETQRTALQNLAQYLTADYLDVYVATSMRSDADFVSVNRFVTKLFDHEALRPLKLRYFNPTQSWIEDRVAKGLVEALMLRRAEFTIYMAQKDDTFGKDSEASVSLGQGKPVIVYVPKLQVAEVDLDSEILGRASRAELLRLLHEEGSQEDREVDETVDNESILGRLLTIRLGKASVEALREAVQQHWADFDLYGEAVRIEDEETRTAYRKWLDTVVKAGRPANLSPSGREKLIGILVAVAIRFHRRANLFREVHPLALQVILSSGVLNGILVARSADSCATLLRNLIENALTLELHGDEHNYRLIETSTASTVRVISKNRLISNAFDAFYQKR